MYMKPIELRITRHPNGGYTYYTILKVFEGVGNTSNVNSKFMTRKDAVDWCKREYDSIPRIFD